MERASRRRAQHAASLPCAMKLWMNSCTSLIGSPTEEADGRAGVGHRARKHADAGEVFGVHGFGSIENGERGVRIHFECAAVFCPT
jgi:hypothetical protein